MTSSSSDIKLKAQYASPSGAHSFSHNISASDLKTVDGRTAYLHELRNRAVQLQGQINDFLTKKMEEDNGSAATGAADSGRKEAEEKARREEENYGEEIIDEDA